MSIIVNQTNVKKIYVGTQAVKKVYVGTQLVWSAVDTGSWGVGTYTSPWGANKFETRIIVTVTEKDYAANSMKIKVDLAIGSVSNYNIVSSVNRTGTVGINGTNHTTPNFTPTTDPWQMNTIGSFTQTITGASAKTITITTSLPINVNVTGVGWIGVVTSSHSVKLPTL